MLVRGTSVPLFFLQAEFYITRGIGFHLQDAWRREDVLTPMHSWSVEILLLYRQLPHG
jgi:hypothetical protein